MRALRGAIDATAFVVWFLATLKSAADAGRDEARFLVRRNQFFLRFDDVLSERQKSVLQTLIEQGLGRLKQGLSAKSYSKIAKVSGPRSLETWARWNVLGRYGDRNPAVAQQSTGSISEAMRSEQTDGISIQVNRLSYWGNWAENEPNS